MEEKLDARPHKLELLNREKGSVTGIQDVVSFDENQMILDTNMGLLTVRGKALHVSRLTLERAKWILRASLKAFRIPATSPTGNRRSRSLDGCSVRRWRMSGTVRGEIWLLGGSVCTGIALMMMYDGLRIFRWLVRHGSFWTGMEDAAYWLFASFATFRLLFGQNDGVLRGYAVAGVLGGMVFYDQTGSRLLFAVLKKCSGWIKMKRRGKKSQKTGKKRTTRGQAENMERK